MGMRAARSNPSFHLTCAKLRLSPAGELKRLSVRFSARRVTAQGRFSPLTVRFWNRFGALPVTAGLRTLTDGNNRPRPDGSDSDLIADEGQFLTAHSVMWPGLFR